MVEVIHPLMGQSDGVAVASALRISRAYRAEGPEFMDARMSDAF